MNALDEEGLVNLMTRLADLSNEFEDNEDDSCQIISVVKSSDWHLVAHTSLFHNRMRIVYNRVSDVVTNERLFRDIQRMIELHGDTKCVCRKIFLQHRKKHPVIEFSERVIRNTITRMRSDSECAHNFVNVLETMN